MRPLACLALAAAIAGCRSYSLDAEMAGLRAEIEAMERDVPPDAPIWVADGEHAFPKFLEDRTARVPDFIHSHILARLAKGRPAEFDALADRDLDWTALMEDPDAWRGRFVRVRGTIASLRADKADPDTGLELVHYGVLWTDGRPALFHVVDKPEVLYLDRDVVQLSAIFVKILRVTVPDGEPVDAPFFMARTLRKYY